MWSRKGARGLTVSGVAAGKGGRAGRLDGRLVEARREEAASQVPRWSTPAPHVFCVPNTPHLPGSTPPGLCLPGVGAEPIARGHSTLSTSLDPGEPQIVKAAGGAQQPT